MRKTLNPDSVFNSLQYGFSQAMVVPPGGRRVMLSGQVGVDAREQTVAGGMAGQTRAALDNVRRVLAEAGGTLADVIMLRLYIAECGSDDQDAIAEALRQYFPENPPPSSWVIVKGLSLPDWLIEIEAEAVVAA